MLGCTPAILRFPRRYPLSFLVLLIPLALWLYYTHFDPLTEWRSGKVLGPDFVDHGSALGEDREPIPKIPPLKSAKDEELKSFSQGPKILLVTSLFSLPTSSKYASRDLLNSLTSLLEYTMTDIYVYTTPDLQTSISSLRANLPITINTTFSSPFDIPPLQGLEEMYEEVPPVKSREGRTLSTIEVAEQVALPYFISSASTTTSFNSEKYDYVFYVSPSFFSTSSISPTLLTYWPSPARVREVWANARRESGMREDELVFLMIRGFPHVSMLLWKEHMGPIQNDFSDLSLLGASPNALQKFSKSFYTYHTYYIKSNLFHGRSDALVNSLILLHPERFFTAWPNDPDVGFEDDKLSGVNTAHSKADETVQRSMCRPITSSSSDRKAEVEYLTYYLSSSPTRSLILSYWSSQGGFPYNFFKYLKFWEWDFRIWRYFDSSPEECRGRLVKVKSIQWLLRKPFGEMWRPPSAEVEKNFVRSG